MPRCSERAADPQREGPGGEQGLEVQGEAAGQAAGEGECSQDSDGERPAAHNHLHH